MLLYALQVVENIVGSLPSGTPVTRPSPLSSSLQRDTPIAQQLGFGRSPVLQVPPSPEQPLHATPGFGFLSPLAGESWSQAQSWCISAGVSMRCRLVRLVTGW